MAAKKDDRPVAELKGVVTQARLHADGSSIAWLAVGIALDGHADEHVVALDAELAAVLYPGREITVEVRLR